MEREENRIKRSNDERGRCGSLESSGRKIAYTGLASEHNKGDERSFIKGKKVSSGFFGSAAPRKIQFRPRDEYAWDRDSGMGRIYRYRFLIGRARVGVSRSDK